MAGRKRIGIDCAEVERLAARGLSEQQIADALGVSVSTLERRKGEAGGEGDAFREALRRGRAQGIGDVANALYQSAVKDKNVVAQIFFLKARAGWKETSVTEIRNADDEWTPEQILGRIRELAAGRGAGSDRDGAAEAGDQPV